MCSWRELGKLIGYLKQREKQGLDTRKTMKGCSFLESLNGACNAEAQLP